MINHLFIYMLSKNYLSITIRPLIDLSILTIKEEIHVHPKFNLVKNTFLVKFTELSHSKSI